MKKNSKNSKKKSGERKHRRQKQQKRDTKSSFGDEKPSTTKSGVEKTTQKTSKSTCGEETRQRFSIASDKDLKLIREIKALMKSDAKKNDGDEHFHSRSSSMPPHHPKKSIVSCSLCGGEEHDYFHCPYKPDFWSSRIDANDPRVRRLLKATRPSPSPPHERGDIDNCVFCDEDHHYFHCPFKPGFWSSHIDANDPRVRRLLKAAKPSTSPSPERGDEEYVITTTTISVTTTTSGDDKKISGNEKKKIIWKPELLQKECATCANCRREGHWYNNCPDLQEELLGKLN